MTRGMYFGRVVPIAALLYVIVLMTVHGSTAAAVGAVAIAVVVLIGLVVTSPAGGRPREARRERRSRRGMAD